LDNTDKQEAIRQYRALIADGTAEATDRARLVSLLYSLGEVDGAKKLVLESVGVSPPDSLPALVELGHRLVGETGDKQFRIELEAAQRKRGLHD
jgi:hypothetical protein